ncbi:ribonuclease H-like domain-containing protein [Tanacetum coccineum]|uniref:Ribonuclease H-like domain-containing protein n=1 Tax=Tanacetum coccineum TaxID=301880 RepID=A0ABQ5EHQ0_9ASTR
MDAKEKPSENAPKDNDVQDSEDVAKKEEQHNLTEAEQALKYDIEKLVTQEMIAKAMDDATRHAFEKEKKNIASTKRAPQATSINKLNTEDDSDAFSNEGIFSGAYDDEDMGAEADFNNMDNTIDVSPIPTLRIHKDHPKGKKAIGTKWVFRNKRDERSIVFKNKARLVAQSFRHEEGIYYDEVFAPVARIEVKQQPDGIFISQDKYVADILKKIDFWSHEAPLHEGHTSVSVEDSLQLKELMVLVPKLVTRIDNLEKEQHHTKNNYGKAVLTLVERVKSLEVALKRKTKKVVVSDLEDEETEN